MSIRTAVNKSTAATTSVDAYVIITESQHFTFNFVYVVSRPGARE